MNFVMNPNLQDLYDRAYAEGVAYEREACAKLCELCFGDCTDGYRIAHIIRSRSKQNNAVHSDSIAVGIKRGWDLAHGASDFPSAEEVCRIVHQETIAELSNGAKRTP